MKKILIMLAVLITILCGCSIKDVKINESEKYKEPLPESFSSELSVTQYSIESKANLDYSVSGEACLTYSSPNIANGMNIIRSASGVKVKYLGLNYENPYNILPKSNVLAVIDGVWQELSVSDNYKAKVSADSVIYEGTYNNAPFLLVRDKKTLSVISITVEAYDLNITFSEFNIT